MRHFVCYCSIILSFAFSAKLSLADLSYNTQNPQFSTWKYTLFLFCHFSKAFGEILWHHVRGMCLTGKVSTNTSVSSIYKKLQKFTFFGIWVRHSVRMSLGLCPAELRNWKWPNGVGNSEMSIIWCISITNNMKTCKKFNERAQTAKFSVFSRLRQELCAENPKNKENKRN